MSKANVWLPVLLGLGAGLLPLRRSCSAISDAAIGQHRPAPGQFSVPARTGVRCHHQQLPCLPLSRHGAQPAAAAESHLGSRGPQDDQHLQGARRARGRSGDCRLPRRDQGDQISREHKTAALTTENPVRSIRGSVQFSGLCIFQCPGTLVRSSALGRVGDRCYRRSPARSRSRPGSSMTLGRLLRTKAGSWSGPL